MRQGNNDKRFGREWRGRERRRERKFQGSRWDRKLNSDANSHTKKEDKRLFGDSISKRTTTFFLTNFPEQWIEKDIWRKLCEYGNLVDVFIGRKKIWFREISGDRGSLFARKNSQRNMDGEVQIKS